MTLSLQFKDYTPSACMHAAKNMTRSTCVCVDYCIAPIVHADTIITLHWLCTYYVKGTNHLVYHVQMLPKLRGKKKFLKKYFNRKRREGEV